MGFQILAFDGETAGDRQPGPAQPAPQRERPLAHQHGAVEFGPVAVYLEAGHQPGEGHHVGVGLHLPLQQVQFTVQQGRGQGAIEAGIGRDDPLQGAHLGDEGSKGRQLEIVKLELTR
ncbi:hypothetical protein D3C72_851640 [compost metagenome]